MKPREYDPAVDSALYIDDELRLWGDKHSIRGFLLREKSEWSWIEKLPSAFHEIYSKFVASVLNGPIEMTELDQCVIRLGTAEHPYLDPSGELGLYIKVVAKTYGDAVGALFMAYSTDYHRRVMMHPDSGTAMKFARDYNYENALAMQLVVNREIQLAKKFDPSELLDQKQRVETANLLAELEESRGIINKAKAETLSCFDKSQQDFTSDFEALSLNVRRSLQRSLRLTRKTTRWIAKRIAVEENDWSAKKSRLNEQLEIKSSTTYWGNRANAHNRAKKGWLALMFIAMATMAGIGYCSTHSLLNSINENYSESNSEALGKNENGNSKIVTLPVATTTKEIADLGKININVDARFIMMIFEKLAIIILTFTFGSIIIRLALRQYSSNVAFATEASERIAFTQTYLALMDEGKLDGREDRNLVLQALFRNTGVALSDIPVTTPIELIVKAAEVK